MSTIIPPVDSPERAEIHRQCDLAALRDIRTAVEWGHDPHGWTVGWTEEFVHVGPHPSSWLRTAAKLTGSHLKSSGDCYGDNTTRKRPPSQWTGLLIVVLACGAPAKEAVEQFWKIPAFREHKLWLPGNFDANDGKVYPELTASVVAYSSGHVELYRTIKQHLEEL